ncbi:MAG: FAD-dependent oxidoreductase [Dehalococcoidia bacterium]|nr:FAD-dependent oxidoreductase [Dehalococcoidia bacterium]
MDEKFDAIVVGSGPAGCAAAYVMAKAGLNVLMIERGTVPGAKNIIGGVLYSKVLNDLFPNFWEEGPVERYINRRIISFVTEDSSVSMDFKSGKFSRPPYNGFTVLRAKFDKWFVEKAEEAGVMFVPGMLVDDLLWAGDKVAGIKVGGDEMPADVVIAADGANSILAQKAKLRGELQAHHVATGVKEVIELPRGVIEERFGLSGDEGMANEYTGWCTQGVAGGAFLYTNKESLSLGLVCNIAALRKSGKRPADMIEEFKQHPAIRNLVRGGEVVEYSAHLIPEGGLEMQPKLCTNGMLVVGDAAGFVCLTGLTLEGANFAISSGIAAAETVKLAKERGDFSAASLSHYESLLNESFVLQDFKTYKGAPQFLENQRMFDAYPNLVASIAESIFNVDGQPKKKMSKVMREALKRSKVSYLDLLKDGLQGVRAL